jgi:ELMO/CED-12 family
VNFWCCHSRWPVHAGTCRALEAGSLAKLSHEHFGTRARQDRCRAGSQPANPHGMPCYVKSATRVCRLCRADLAVGGAQGTDPGTDFRGAGLLALECLLFLAQRQPALFDKLRHKREGARSQWEYPFAVAGVNLTFMLLGGQAAHRLLRL